MDWMQAVPVEAISRWLGWPAMRFSGVVGVLRMCHPPPGVAWMERVGPVKLSKPHMPLTVPVMGWVGAAKGKGLVLGGELGGGDLLGVGGEAGRDDGWDGEFLALRLRWGDGEAAPEGVGIERDVGTAVGEGGSGGEVEVKDDLVGEGGGEDERRAVDGEDHPGIEEAGGVVGFGGTKRGEDGLLDGREADDDDGFGVVEAGRGVEAEVEGVVLREGDGGDVLELRGVEAAGEADEIDDGADVGGVEAAAGHAGVGGLVDEVRGGAVGEGGGDGLAVAVVQERGWSRSG